MNATSRPAPVMPGDRVTTYDGTPHPLHNSRVVTDYAFGRNRGSSGVISGREFGEVHYGAPVFGYTVRTYEVTDRDGYPMDVVEFIKELPNPAAEADQFLILDTDAAHEDRMAAFERHNARASGNLVEPTTYLRHHLYVVEYFTRVACITHEHAHAQHYASVTDDAGFTTLPMPYCGECMYHLRRSADQASHTVNESPALRIGQHE